MRDGVGVAIGSGVGVDAGVGIAVVARGSVGVAASTGVGVEVDDTATATVGIEGLTQPAATRAKNAKANAMPSCVGNCPGRALSRVATVRPPGLSMLAFLLFPNALEYQHLPAFTVKREPFP